MKVELHLLPSLLDDNGSNVDSIRIAVVADGETQLVFVLKEGNPIEIAGEQIKINGAIYKGWTDDLIC